MSAVVLANLSTTTLMALRDPDRRRQAIYDAAHEVGYVIPRNNTAKEDSAWNRFIDLLDREHPGWRGND